MHYSNTKAAYHVHVFYFYKQVCFRHQAQICVIGFVVTSLQYVYI